MLYRRFQTKHHQNFEYDMLKRQDADTEVTFFRNSVRNPAGKKK